jgi:gliding motility-associated-like protein
VPAGDVTVPYTMTYAYAMVLENGTHNSNQQPLFKATLSYGPNVITCASPQYYLPTFNDAAGGNGGGSTGATLDSATAIANGFTNSPVPFLSFGGQGNEGGRLLYDVWTKGWTEVTFDLSPYRGQQVQLTFEADNCTPGAHFAYAYVALRNTCAGLEISGHQTACTNNPINYAIPALAGATYNWTVPSGWTINSGSNGNIINVTPGATGGQITVQQVNSCADLRDTIDIVTTPPTVAGSVSSDATVCAGINSTALTLSGEFGGLLNWVSSTDNGLTWRPVSHTGGNYSAQNLTTTTQFAAVVQNGPTCRVDTSRAALITVDEPSRGGVIEPSDMTICAGQNMNTMLTLKDYVGSVLNWQQSGNAVNWNNVSPANTSDQQDARSITANTLYRAIVQNGVCPADTSEQARVAYTNVRFPQADIDPEYVKICYGRSALLQADISVGTNYTWSNTNTLTVSGNGLVPGVPYSINATATPGATTKYVLSVYNMGCPNAFTDTFEVEVTPPIIVNAGNDTAVVINQLLQLNATVNQQQANIFTWSPGTSLSSSSIPNPTAMYGPSAPASITYAVQAATAEGCTGMDSIKVRIFKTPADIFMPSGFTPNGDGQNEILRPVYAGIQRLIYYRIYNRWGQLVFSTNNLTAGWDGRVGSATPSTGNYVYMIQGIDYTGRVIVKKGNVVLIR